MFVPLVTIIILNTDLQLSDKQFLASPLNEICSNRNSLLMIQFLF